MATDIESVLKEQRVFPPPDEFAASAHVKSLAEYQRIYKQSVDDPEAFWAGIGRELDWFKPWDKVLEWDPPHAKWFVGAECNISYNCLDRHLCPPGAGTRPRSSGRVSRATSGFLPTRCCTSEVSRFAAALKRLGVKKGDRVALYMPMVPELAISLLACARLGATHSVVFGGFSSDALRDRINDAQAKVVITADGGFRRGAPFPLKEAVDKALTETPSIEKVVVVKRAGNDVVMKPGRDVWWDDAIKDVSADCPAEHLDAEHPLFILYTSGTTGKPKGVVHSTGGYMAHTYLTSKWVFDLKDTDTFWCTADVGWVTGHSYIVYGPLANGATIVMYEGVPNHPEPDRFWDIIERHQVSVLYTAPTAIRTFTRWGDEWPKKHDLSSLRLLGTVGEPINPEAWIWYRDVIGGNRCPIVDTWWQTETGGIMLTPLPGCDADQARLGDACLFPVSCPKSLRTTASPSATTKGAISSSKSRGPACSAPSTTIPSASRSSTGVRFRGATSRVTARAATRTATTGSWGGSTTSSTSPGTD